MFSLMAKCDSLPSILPTVKRQLFMVDTVWERVREHMSQKQLIIGIHRECDELNLPSHLYNFEPCFIKAETEWCSELKTRVKDMITDCFGEDMAIDLKNLTI